MGFSNTINGVIARIKPHFNSQPPNLDEIFKKWLSGNKANKSNTSGSNRTPSDGNQLPIKTYLIGLVVIWLFSGFFIVSPAEQAVVLQWGKYSRTMGPGPHWIPQIVQNRTIVNVNKISNFSMKDSMLTEDENIVDVELSVQYRITNPVAYLYHVEGPIMTIQEATASALRQVVGSTKLDEILTSGREQAKDEIEAQLIATTKEYDLGLEVTDVNLQPAQPPAQVTTAFDDAIKAREDEQRYVNEAKAYKEKIVHQAEGTSARIMQQAEAEKEKVVKTAESKLARFNALLDADRQAPDLTQQRLYYQAMQRILSHTKNVIVDYKDSTPFINLPFSKVLQGEHSSSASESATADTIASDPSMSRPINIYHGAKTNSTYSQLLGEH